MSFESFFAVFASMQPDLRLFKVPFYANLVGEANFGQVRKMAAATAASFNPP